MRRQRDGLIVNVTSIAGRLIMPGCGLYCASKFALEAYCEALHYELTGSGVERVIVEPGPFPTQFFANSPAPKDVERAEAYGPLAGVRTLLLERFREMFALGQGLSPQQVADEIERIIGLPQRFRRLRTICGLDYGASALNDRAAYVQAELLCAMGMPEMAAAASQVEEAAA